MKVLWVVNIILPQAAHLCLGAKVATGGWIGAMAAQLAGHPSVDLAIATRGPVSTVVSEKVGDILFYLLPEGGSRPFDVNASDAERVLQEFQPDLVHVEGTEFAHANTFLTLWKGANVVSLQGVINGYEPYQFGGLPILDMLFSSKYRLFALSLIYRDRKLFRPRLSGEAATIALAKNILGRTTWDRAHAYALNPSAPYFSCRRILRDAFYQSRWDIEKCKRRSLFVGNSAAPLKGAHFLVRAIAQLKMEFPDIHVTIAGESPTGGSSLSKKIGYPAYLLRLIQELGVEKHIEFSGMIQADDMARRLRQAHCYVLTSVIENSPNTLGEAMIQGVPCIAAYSGGVPDMARDGEEALLYRDNDPQLLAFQIKRIFDNDALALQLSENSAKRARETHDPETNYRDLLTCYQSITGEELVAQAVRA